MKGSEYILPIKVDDTDLPGLQPTIGYLGLKEYGVDRIAEILVKKLRMFEVLHLLKMLPNNPRFCSSRVVVYGVTLGGFHFQNGR